MKDHIDRLRNESLRISTGSNPGYGSFDTRRPRSSRWATAEMENFLRRKGEILSSLEGIRKEIGALERCREALASETSRAGVQGIVDGFEDARVYITNQLQRIKVQIEEESDATEEFGQKYGTQSSTDLRARRSGCLMLLHEMKKLIGLLYGEVEEFRRDLRMHLKSQLAIALPNANDEELEEALDKGIDLRQVLKKRSSTGRVMKLQELQDQRSAVVLLEKSVVETQEMMSTLAVGFILTPLAAIGYSLAAYKPSGRAS